MLNYGLLLIVALPLLAVALFFIMHLGLWLQARSNSVEVSLYDIFITRCQGLVPVELIEVKVSLDQAGIDVPYADLQCHALSGGSVRAVQEAAVIAKKADFELEFVQLCRLDLAGRDVCAAMATYVSPKIISCPKDKKQYIKGVTRDGVRLGVQVAVTVKADVLRLVGSAGIETISARVGECIIQTIGRCEDHRNLVNQPNLLSEALKDSSLERDTAYDVVSLDVQELEVFDNVGAALALDLAGAQSEQAQAEAEAKRAEAKATQQEMRARGVEMQANLLLSKSNVPQAIRKATGKGVLAKRQNGFNSPHSKFTLR